MLVQMIPCYTANIYNKNIRKPNQNVTFQSTNGISDETYAESERLAKKAIDLFKNLQFKYPTIDGIRVVDKDYPKQTKHTTTHSFNHNRNYFQNRYSNNPITLCKKYEDTEAILQIGAHQDSNRKHEICVSLMIKGKELKSIEYTSNNGIQCTKYRHGRFDEYCGLDVDPSEKDLQIFNKYVSDILKSSDKLKESFS